jgi:hypothetical protein
LKQALGKKLAILLIVGIVLYALAGFLLAPRVIEGALKAAVQQESGLTLEIASTSVNPFTLTLTATNVNLSGAENKAIILLDRLDVELQVSSLLGRAWIVRTLLVDHALVTLEVADSSSSAALRLCDAFWRSISGNSDSGVNRIGLLAIRDSEIRVRATTRGGIRPETAVSLTEVDLELRDLGTTSPVPFELTATADGFVPGFRWSVAELQGNAAIGQRHGQAYIDGDLTLRKLDIVDSASSESVANVATVAGTGIVVAPSKAVVSVDTARLENPRVRIEQGAAGELSPSRRLVALLLDTPAIPVTIARIEVVGGRAEFADTGVSPAVRLASDEIAGSIARNTPDPQSALSLSLRGRLADSGSGEIIAEWLPSRTLDATRIDVRLQNFPLSPVSPYLAQTIGRPVAGGSLDLALQLSLDDERLNLENRIDVRELRLGENGLIPAADDLPLELAVALLEDDAGLIAFQVPVEQRLVTSGFDPAALFAQAFTDYVIELTSKPLENLAELAGAPDLDLGAIEFLAGSAEIIDESATKLAVLDSVLERRPKLGLIAYPGYDPVIDREALARQQIRLHVVLATSSRPPGQANDASIDFADPKVHSVLEEFATNRLSTERRSAIDSRFSDRNATYYRAVFDALVANEQVGEATLNRLAGFRARSVVDSLVASGKDDGRLRPAAVVEATRAAGDRAIVRLEVQSDWP